MMFTLINTIIFGFSVHYKIAFLDSWFMVIAVFAWLMFLLLVCGPKYFKASSSIWCFWMTLYVIHCFLMVSVEKELDSSQRTKKEPLDETVVTKVTV